MVPQRGLIQCCKPNAIASILPMKHKGLLLYHCVYHILPHQIKHQSTTVAASPQQPTDTNIFRRFLRAVFNPTRRESDSDGSPPTRIPRHLCWCFPGSPVPTAEVSCRRTTRLSICPCGLDEEEHAAGTQ